LEGGKTKRKERRFPKKKKQKAHAELSKGGTVGLVGKRGGFLASEKFKSAGGHANHVLKVVSKKDSKERVRYSRRKGTTPKGTETVW